MKPVCVYTVTYNRPAFLRRAIENVLQQTFSDFEYILLDNGSTDETPDICREYSLKDPRIRVMRLKKNSVPKAFFTALNEASKLGQYFIQFDDDDYAEPDMLEFLFNNALKYNADISMCGSYTVYQDGGREPYFIYNDLYTFNKIEALEQLLRRKLFNVAPPTKLFKSNTFDASFKNNDKRITINDIHLTYKHFALAENVVAQGVPKYYFYKHGSNVTSYIQTNTLTPELLEQYLWAFANRTRYLSRKVPGIEAFARYSEWSYMLSMCNKIQTLDINSCNEQYEKMLTSININVAEFSSSPYLTEDEKLLLKKITG
jgi:glycosyltransferase involved in cell wall biosynthesis